jgi:hypothetical protein
MDSQEDPPTFEIRRSILTLCIRDFRQELKSHIEELGRAHKCVRYVTEQSHHSTFDAESDAKYLRLWLKAKYGDKTKTETKTEREDWWPVFVERAIQFSLRMICFGGPKLPPKEVANITKLL